MAEAVRLWFFHLFLASHVVDTQQTLSVLSASSAQVIKNRS